MLKGGATDSFSIKFLNTNLKIKMSGNQLCTLALSDFPNLALELLLAWTVTKFAYSRSHQTHPFWSLLKVCDLEGWIDSPDALAEGICCACSKAY